MPRSSQITIVWSASARQHSLDNALVRLVGILDPDQEPLWRLANFDAPGAFPSAGEEACAVFTAESKVTLDLPVPAGQTGRDR